MFCRKDCKDDKSEEPKREPPEMETREVTMPAAAWKLLDGLAYSGGNTAGQVIFSLIAFWRDTIYKSSDIVECRKLHFERLEKMGSKHKED